MKHVDDGIFEEDQILKNLEGVTEGKLHHEVVVMLGPQCIISPQETNVFIEKELFFDNYQCGSGTHLSNEVYSPPMIFSQDILFPGLIFRIKLEYG